MGKPGDHDAWPHAKRLLEAAIEALNREDWGECERLVYESLDRHPLPQGYLLLSLMWRQRQDHDRAMALAHRAVLLDPAFGPAYLEIAVHLIDTGQPQEAVGFLIKARDAFFQPTPHLVHYYLGRAFEDSGLPEQARDAYRQSLADHSGFVLARRALKRLKGKPTKEALI
ncbi:MAG: hypothetical protein COX57_05960 [Alphaproteobacteria bacterium CG_4_10_14_0_2_um_filter_63_37]|nr:MAG: hypothetical protein AUJ55_06980 [Proteobacteria bacterium CG1_02_64_396]PJA24859.1 MAG: hypothetical protein COX57_05960 [Alphaproteobacteria bacterium CG_4_10_14_0_2_um_filter_63_37]